MIFHPIKASAYYQIPWISIRTFFFFFTFFLQNTRKNNFLRVIYRRIRLISGGISVSYVESIVEEAIDRWCCWFRRRLTVVSGWRRLIQRRHDTEVRIKQLALNCNFSPLFRRRAAENYGTCVEYFVTR